MMEQVSEQGQAAARKRKSNGNTPQLEASRFEPACQALRRKLGSPPWVPPRWGKVRAP